jgi:hypothetical protein
MLDRLVKLTATSLNAIIIDAAVLLLALFRFSRSRFQFLVRVWWSMPYWGRRRDIRVAAWLHIFGVWVSLLRLVLSHSEASGSEVSGSAPPKFHLDARSMKLRKEHL